MPRSLLFGLSLCLFIVLAGCRGGRSPSEPGGSDSITLTSISPTAGALLAHGSVVTFTATVAYTLSSASTGNIRLVVEDQNNNLLTVTQPTVSVTRGQGSVTLTDQITVPATGVSQVRVFLPLNPGSASTTNVVANANYPVG
jgi:hypothetical protein